MKELEKNGLGGEIVNYDLATVFPIISGIELLYFNKNGPKQDNDIKSVLKDIPSTIIVQKCSMGDFCIVYQMGKHLPVYFSRYGCETALLINTEMLPKEDMQAFLEIWEFAQNMAGKFQLGQQFLVAKLCPQMKEIFEELQQIPFPPIMFRFYMQLKVYEILIQLSILNLYGTQVHFYPYQDIAREV